MNKGIKIVLIIIFLILIGIGSYFIVRTITKNYLKETKTIKNINLKPFISNFNKNLEEYEMETELSIDEIEADKNKTYWIKIEEDVSIAIMMDKITENKNEDVVRISGLAYSTDYSDTEKINKYIEILIKTNNSKLNNNDIKTMIKNANDMSKSIEKDGNKTSPTFDYKGLGIDKNINSETTMYRIARYDKY